MYWEQHLQSLSITFEPIYVSADDSVTEETAQQILQHNEVYESLCEE